MPLSFSQKPVTLKICEICGNKFIMQYGYSLAVCWLVTGHAHIGSYMCQEAEGNQHWGCSPEHALEAAIICAKEHMHPSLLQKHEACLQNENLPRIALDEKGLYDETDKNFHIIETGN